MTDSSKSSTSGISTVREVAGSSLARFVIIAVIAGLPAFLEGFDSEIYSFGSAYIVPSLTGPAFFSIGLMITGYAIGIAIFSLVGGYLFDRYSVKNTVLISVAVFSIFTFLTGFVTNTPELFIFRLLVGVGVGMFQPSGVALLGDLFFETRGKAVSVWATFFGAGIFASPYLISPFLPAFRIPFEISGIASVVILALVFFAIPGTYKKEARMEKIRISGLFNRNIILLSISVFFFGIALFAGFLGYFSAYLKEGLHINAAHAAVIASMAGLGGLIFAMPFGWISDRTGRKSMVIFTSLLIAAGTLGMFVLASSFTLLAVSSFIFGSGWGVFINLLVALGQDSVKDGIVGSVSGFLFFAFNVGTMIGGPLYAFVLAGNSFVTSSVVAVVVPAFISLSVILFSKNVTKSNVEEKPEFLSRMETSS